jgi:hypothetical protein
MKQNGMQIMTYAGEVNLLGERVNSTKTHTTGQTSLQMRQTRNTFTGLNNIPNHAKKTTNCLLSDFRPKLCMDSSVPILPCQI